MSIPQSDIALKALEAHYRVRLEYILFPLEYRELRDILAKNGYELSLLPAPIPPRPSRISYSGDIARKGEYTVNVDSDLGTVGISGKSMGMVIAAFEELTKVIKEGLGIDLNENVCYFEIIAHYNIDTGKKPVQEIDRVIEGNPYFSKFNKIIGEPTSLFSIRLMPRGKIPNQEEWFDISVEPDILKSELYHIGVIYRNPKKEKTLNFASNLEKTLVNLVKAIEGEE
jgi:hypothetical protein